MIGHKMQRPPVPGSSTIPGHGGGHGNGRAGGAKNPRSAGHHKQLTIGTFNTRTLRRDEDVEELEVELRSIKWHILGLSEVRREGEDTVILESGNLFYYREGDQLSQGGVGFIVHKAIANNVLELSSVSSRVVYIIVKISERYLLKVVQVYAPTATHPDCEVEALYEDISKAIHNTTKTHFTVVVGDFNAKVGIQGEGESIIGRYGLGTRNHRGQMLVNFLQMEGLYLMNSFFKKKPQRRWTWQSADKVTRNEIDFIMADKKRIFTDVSVVNRFSAGSDHRLIRGTINIDIRLERTRLMRSTLRPSLPQIIQVSDYV